MTDYDRAQALGNLLENYIEARNELLQLTLNLSAEFNFGTSLRAPAGASIIEPVHVYVDNAYGRDWLLRYADADTYDVAIYPEVGDEGCAIETFSFLGQPIKLYWTKKQWEALYNET